MRDAGADANHAERGPLDIIRSPKAVLLLLAVINFFNYLDRLIIVTIIPVLKEDLDLSGTQIGLLGSAFAWVLALSTVPLGWLADRWMRKWVIALGVGLWSLATAAGALATGFHGLLVSRALVGIGEATYAPAANALIAEDVPKERLARAISVFNLGMIAGSAAGMALGGILAARFGWRAAVLIVGLPGLALSALVLLLHERRRETRVASSALAVAPELGGRIRRVALAIVGRPALLAVFGGGTLVNFFVWGLIHWVNLFLIEDHGFEAKKASVFAFFMILMAGTGVWAGGAIGDRWTRSHPGGRLLASGAGMLIGVPLVAVMLLVPSRFAVFALLVSSVFFLTWFTAPIVAALCALVGEKNRATWTAPYFLIVQLLGSGLSPFIIGRIADASSVRIGMLASVPVGVAGGLVLLWGAAAMRREAIADLDRARRAHSEQTDQT